MSNRVQRKCRQTKEHYIFPMKGQNMFPSAELGRHRGPQATRKHKKWTWDRRTLARGSRARMIL
eukprot:9261820-Pyramimonas_sp.AAC.1